MPVSATIHSTKSPLASPEISTDPSNVNLIALLTRFVNTWIILSRSAKISIFSPENRTRRSMSFSLAFISKVDMTCSASRTIFNRSFRVSIFPASILETSSTLLISLASRSILSFAAKRIISCFSVISPATLSNIRFRPSLVIERGVRSSWETIEINSVFIASISFSFVTSRKMITVPILLSFGPTGDMVHCKTRHSL